MLKCVDDYPYPGVTSVNIPTTYENMIGHNVVPTTAKSKAAYDEPGSNRQAVIELLALTEVLRREDPNVQTVMILKTCTNKFKVFIYFSDQDLLITSCDVKIEEISSTESMMGCLLLFFSVIYHQS